MADPGSDNGYPVHYNELPRSKQATGYRVSDFHNLNEASFGEFNPKTTKICVICVICGLTFTPAIPDGTITD